eukprot:gnl/TRDRNA2_/TRDRNA2_139344_c0_seq1.p1 gnl/TRDRNA2_/TRDRNA2_139344_c0~~gnl/TRDRNA2_/TRDRNA2_139344_c0_seq1.p1  ORF type:complete len:268 (+),score=24.27 gnl/TRDRNA2_/TRDRNA2_139344_c0_seq1:391-1194(+)
MLRAAVKRRMNSFSTQGLANIAWASTTAGSCDMTLHAMLARAVQRRISAFNAQDVADTTWALVTAGPPDMSVIRSLARSAVRYSRNFKLQELVKAAWAFAAVTRSDASLPRALTRVAEQCIKGFNPENLRIALWALCRNFESLRDARSLLDHAERYFDPPAMSPSCFGALLMEFEQRALFEDNIGILRRLERTRDNHEPEMGFRVAARRVSAVALAKLHTATTANFHESSPRNVEHPTLQSAAMVCIWCMCAGQGRPPLAWPKQSQS